MTRRFADRDALEDILEAIKKYHLAATFGWQDVAQRYRRSRVGAFWLTINMGVLIGALGLVFGNLFHSPMQEFLPFICVGMVVWGLISSCVVEGCTSLISADVIILQVRMPIFTHILRALWRNIIIFCHNLVIYPFVLLAFLIPLPSTAALAIPGLLVVLLNLAWMMLVLGIACARFRDLTQLVQNLLQVTFYVTPVMWQPRSLPNGASPYLLDFNPFYHLVTLLRTPLLGGIPTLTTWKYAIAMLILGWIFALWLFDRYRRRIAYWL
ncbi:ABC transporter permease [Mesorhizobium sp. SARCC-RB16n]|nr:ABC transporter permease [Mesorhizobium sp. SARCC-RB16n]